MLTQQKQNLTTFHGFDTPKEFLEIGVEKKYIELMKKADTLFKKMHEVLPEQAQYIVPFGYRVRWALSINARELYHMVELRSTVQGHSDYRRIAIKMLEEAKKATPEIMAAMKFVQAQGVELERLQAEKWTDKQIEAVEKKYSKK